MGLSIEWVKTHISVRTDDMGSKCFLAGDSLDQRTAFKTDACNPWRA
jgi:hypothetical protein